MDKDSIEAIVVTTKNIKYETKLNLTYSVIFLNCTNCVSLKIYMHMYNFSLLFTICLALSILRSLFLPSLLSL